MTNLDLPMGWVDRALDVEILHAEGRLSGLNEFRSASLALEAPVDGELRDL